MTQLFGIVGDPIAQVRSPEVFNRLFRERGIDAEMLPVQVKADDLQQALEGLRKIDNLAGLIITVPHKAAAARLARQRSERAGIAMAVNVLRPCADGGEGGWEGDLFDGEGFAVGMAAQGHRLAGARCALVGGGGAGAAIALALLERNVASLSLWDIDPQRCAELADRLRRFRPVEILIGLPDALTDIAINATPLGMAEDDPLPMSIASLRPDAVVADAIMKPPVTRLLLEAEKKGCKVQEGRHMLDYQVKLIWAFFRLP